MTILTLWKQGKSQREIAKLVNHDRKTIRKIIKVHEKTGSTESFPIRKNSKLDPYKEDILMYLENNLTNLRVYEEIKYKGCKASYRLLCYYIASLKDRENICIRFHTTPGEEAQVDFGYAGFLPDPQGKKRKAWVFSMRLSYSRLDYADIVFDQKVSTFILCHINAFKYFEGVPKTVKIDNLKAAIWSCATFV